MRRWILVLLALVGAVTSFHAQVVPQLSEEQARAYQKAFEGALTAHQAGKYDEAIAGFKSCLALVPADGGCAYNIACGYALKKEPDAAFEWLDRAVAFGFGRLNIETDELGLAGRDPDFVGLRADARFAQVLERMKAGAKAVDDYVNQPAVYVPAALAGVSGVPVLIVLHDQGATKDAPLQSFWKAVADELGLVLIAPSARIPVSDEPAKGMSWMSDPQTYEKGYWKYEKPINAAFDAFNKQQKVDKTRVFLAGEGQGGLVAFDAALGAPGLYKGVVVLDAPVLMSLVSSKAANAAKMGFRGKLFLGQRIFGAPPDTDVKALVEGLGKALKGAGLANVSVASYASDPAIPEARKQLALDALREFLAATQPTEAAAPK